MGTPLGRRCSWEGPGMPASAVPGSSLGPLGHFILQRAAQWEASPQQVALGPDWALQAPHAGRSTNCSPDLHVWQ